MSWADIERRVQQNDEDPKIGPNPLRSEVVDTLKRDSRVSPDSFSGQDKKMVFVRLADTPEMLLGLQISNKKSVGIWCDAVHSDILASAGLATKTKLYNSVEGTNNTGRHSGLDRPNRFDQAPLLYLEAHSSADALKVVDLISTSEVDWTKFWQGFLDEAKLTGVTAGSRARLTFPLDAGSWINLVGKAGGVEVTTQLTFEGERAASQYSRLLSILSTIEKRFAGTLRWETKGARPGSFSVSHTSRGHDLSDPDRWMETYTYFMNSIEQFRKSISDLERVGGE